jgi:hypothetical protein
MIKDVPVNLLLNSEDNTYPLPELKSQMQGVIARLGVIWLTR